MDSPVSDSPISQTLGASPAQPGGLPVFTRSNMLILTLLTIKSLKCQHIQPHVMHNPFPRSKVEGRSLTSVFSNDQYKSGPLYWEHEGNAAVRVGR